MPNRSLTLLCMSLVRASSWQVAAPMPHGRAQCCQISTRQALAPQMCSDHLSSEFQVCAHATRRRTRRSPPPLTPALSLLAETGGPAHGHRVRRPSCLAATAQGGQRVGAALQRRRAQRGRVRSGPWPVSCPPTCNPSRLTARTGLASTGTLCRAVRHPRRATARTCSRSSSTRRRLASESCCRRGDPFSCGARLPRCPRA